MYTDMCLMCVYSHVFMYVYSHVFIYVYACLVYVYSHVFHVCILEYMCT